MAAWMHQRHMGPLSFDVELKDGRIVSRGA